MCNRYGHNISYPQYVEGLAAAKLTLVYPAAHQAPNLEPLPDIRPTDMAPVLLPTEGGVKLTRLRWGLIPWFHHGTIKEWKPLTTNARSETITTTATYKAAFQRHRCLIPVSEYFEWTGEKGHKEKWSFTRPDGQWFCFAGIWDRAKTADGLIESFALLTQAAGRDTQPYHDRQPVILDRAGYQDWLNPIKDVGQILKFSSTTALKTQAS